MNVYIFIYVEERINGVQSSLKFENFHLPKCIFFSGLVQQCIVLCLLIELDFAFYLTGTSVTGNFAQKCALIYSSLLIFRLISVFLLREGFLRVLEQKNTQPSQWSFVEFFLKDWIYNVAILKRLIFSCEMDNRSKNCRK